MKIEYRVVCMKGCTSHTWRKPTLASAARSAVKLNEQWPQLKRNQLGADSCLPFRVEMRQLEEWRPAE